MEQKYRVFRFEGVYKINGEGDQILFSGVRAFKVDEFEDGIWEAAYDCIKDNSYPKDITIEKNGVMHYDKIRDFLKDMDVYDITEEEYKMMSYYGLDDIGYDVYELFYNVACCCGFDANEYYDEHKN